jgi:DNA repair photolyase
MDRALPRIRRGTTKGDRTIVIGSATDPYQPAERNYRVTQAVLERLRAERNLHVGIITKSPLIARDAPLLAELSSRHTLSVNISIISADASIVRAFEPKSPLPHARLRALGRLSSAGVRAGVLVAPILPGVTDSKEHLTSLLSAVKQAGAQFAHYAPFRLYAGLRGLFYPALGSFNRALPARYHVNFPDMGHAPAPYRAALSKRFHSLAAAHGFVREERQAAPPPGEPQLDLWQEGR